MLVLSREVEQTIVIVLPDNRTIEVKVVDIRGSKTRIGVTADKDIQVHRSEVWQEIRREGSRR